MSKQVHLGDQGTTQGSLVNAKRLSKGDAIFDFYGDGDELIAVINLCIQIVKDSNVKSILQGIVESIYFVFSVAGLETYDQGLTKIGRYLSEWERVIEKIAKSKRLHKFILIWPNKEAAYLNWARSISRRWERTIYRTDKLRFSEYEEYRAYFNRLSSVLFELSLYFTKLETK